MNMKIFRSILLPLVRRSLANLNYGGKFSQFNIELKFEETEGNERYRTIESRREKIKLKRNETGKSDQQHKISILKIFKSKADGISSDFFNIQHFRRYSTDEVRVHGAKT